MKKKLKIGYKVYANTRLKPVYFHGAQQHPVYIVVVYWRIRKAGPPDSVAD